MPKRTYEWSAIKADIARLVETRQIKPTYREISRALRIPFTTIHDNIDIMEYEELAKSAYADDMGGTDEGIETSRFETRTIGNRTIATAESDHPTTRDEMAQLMGIDLEEWIVKVFECRARQVVVRDSEKDLYFDEGRITGHSADEGPRVTTVWTTIMQVEPVDVKPQKLVLQPVEIPWSQPEIQEPIENKNAIRTLVIPDLHIGFIGDHPIHDVKFIAGIYGLIQKFKPDAIVYLGDVQDMAEFTDSFVKNPATIKTTQMSLVYTADMFAKVRTLAPAAEIYYLEGNHELRMQNSVWKHLSAIAGLYTVGGSERGIQPISLPYLLGLDKMGVVYVGGYPNNAVQIGDVTYVHGDITASQTGAAAAKMLEKYGRSVVFGHIHRFEFILDNVYSDMAGGRKQVFALSPGHGANVANVPGAKTNNSWARGVAVIETFADERPTIVRPIVYQGGNFLI